MNCDRIARFYRWFEYLRFGRRLERCRVALLDRITPQGNALLAGEGDGRFLEALRRRYPKLSIDYVDVSAGMAGEARRRNAGARFIEADLRTAVLPPARYSVVVTHFFFDVFAQEELSTLVSCMARSTRPGAQWLVSEFDYATGRWPQGWAKFWLAVMYRLFRHATGLRNQRLPAWRPLLAEQGFAPQDRYSDEFGFIQSELWQKRL